MLQHERLEAARTGTDYQAPLRSINHIIDNLVDGAFVVHSADTPLTPEMRALDAIGVQIMRELKNRADMIHALVFRCNTLEARLKGEPDPVREPTMKERVQQGMRAATMPEQQHEQPVQHIHA